MERTTQHPPLLGSGATIVNHKARELYERQQAALRAATEIARLYTTRQAVESIVAAYLKSMRESERS